MHSDVSYTFKKVPNHLSVLEIISQGIEIEYVTWLIVWVFSFVVFEVFMNESLGAFFRVIRVCRVVFGYVTTSQIKVAKTLDTTYTLKLCEKHVELQMNCEVFFLILCKMFSF